jgi:hypothetical protein
MTSKECKMPDVANFANVKLMSFTLANGLIGNPGVPPKEASYRRHLSRLIDKAVSEYQAARCAILAHGNFGILEFINHFENCINALHRALNLVERLGKSRGAAHSQGLRRAIIKAHSGKVRKVRDLVEHIDEDIQNDKIRQGQPDTLSIGSNGDRALIGAHELRFVDVVGALRELHRIGRLLFNPGES